MDNNKYYYIKSVRMAQAIFWLTMEHYTPVPDKDRKDYTVYRFPRNSRVTRAIKELNNLRNSFDEELRNK